MSGITSLAQGRARLEIAPALGGGLVAFVWDGREIMRRGVANGSPLDLASFVLLPFCNRISRGAKARSRIGVDLPVNAVNVDPRHAIHGYGWQAGWSVIEHNDRSARLVHSYDGYDWPWRYEAEQLFELDENGFDHRLSLANRSDSPMPAGLGLHPYFPRADAQLDFAASGIWRNDPSGLPEMLEPINELRDWLDDAPLDNVFVGREGPITIRWPDHTLRIFPDAELSFVHVYSPHGEDFFCVEPVSHMPNALDRSETDSETGQRWLEPGEEWTVNVRFGVERTN